jgi:hypothetical protein
MRMFAFSIALVACLPVLVVTEAQAGAPETIAILQIGGDTTDEGLRASLVDAVAVELGRLPATKVITRNEINSMLGLERLKDSAGCSDVGCLAEIGGALGVERLVAGTLAHQTKDAADFYSLTLQLLDTKRAEVLRRETVTWEGKAEGLYQLLPSTVVKLVAGPAADDFRGSLVLTTPVVGAQVLVDGREVGRTPLGAPVVLPLGKATIDVLGDDYEPFRQVAVIDKDKTTALVVNLVEKPKAPIYAHWWFWTAAAVVVGGAATTAILLTRNHADTGSGTFGVQLPTAIGLTGGF